jgi:hypothetical protein
MDRQTAGPKPFSREWLNVPPEQRAIPQRAPVGPPPSWLPSDQVVAITLVILLVLLASMFQTTLAPGIETNADGLRTSALDVTATPGAGDPATSVAGAGVVASPTVIATPGAGVGAGIDAEPLLPANRIVAYYGHPNDENMGILGQFGMEGLLDQLLDEAAAYERADPTRPVIPAFEIIGSVAQADPGPDGSYILQTDEATMRDYIEFTQENDILLIIDVQIGRSSVQDELALIETYLTEPNVHLAIDPEFAMGPDQIPGVDFGSIDAKDINFAQQELARIAEENNLPPKLLIVHRFTDGMVTNINRVQSVDHVQFVLDFDGFGDPLNKAQGYQLYVRDGEVPFGGIKLFYDQDKPLMQPAEVVELDPSPDFVMYQ